MPCTKHNLKLCILLKTSGFKITPARLQLLEVLSHTQKPLSVKDISRKLKRSAIDTATLYRNLKALVAQKLANEVIFDGKKIYYELSNHGHHHHLICQHCGKIKDITACKIKRLSQTLLKYLHFKNIQQHSLEFFGICQKCAKK
jgi:Fe2+ or Zn2+ uptake regulation protein